MYGGIWEVSARRTWYTSLLEQKQTSRVVSTGPIFQRRVALSTQNVCGQQSWFGEVEVVPRNFLRRRKLVETGSKDDGSEGH